MTDDETRYCSACGVYSTTDYNDFMVGFCSKCHSMRGRKSDYTGQKIPFRCTSCGKRMDEIYVGQQLCPDCKHDLEDESDG